MRSTDPKLAARQDRWHGLWLLFGAGCHCNRDTERAITRAAFHIERISHGQMPKMPAIVQPLVTGVARPTVMEEAMGERDGSGLGDGHVRAGCAFGTSGLTGLISGCQDDWDGRRRRGTRQTGEDCTRRCAGSGSWQAIGALRQRGLVSGELQPGEEAVVAGSWCTATRSRWTTAYPALVPRDLDLEALLLELVGSKATGWWRCSCRAMCDTTPPRYWR